jgi:hypothetical protein
MKKKNDLDKLQRNLRTFLSLNPLTDSIGFDVSPDILADVMISSALTFGLKLRCDADGVRVRRAARRGRKEPALVDVMNTVRNRERNMRRPNEEG